MGVLKEKYLHCVGGNFPQKVDYNIRGWLTAINAPSDLDDDLFGMNLHYNDISSLTKYSSKTTNYNGNITVMLWNTAEDKVRGYVFEYDDLNRLFDASYGEGVTLGTNSGANDT